MIKFEMIIWLHECARFFKNRPTNGDDLTHWSNVYNAENAIEIADFIHNLELVDEERVKKLLSRVEITDQLMDEAPSAKVTLENLINQQEKEKD